MNPSDPIVIVGAIVVTAVAVVYMKQSSGPSQSQIRSLIEQGIRFEHQNNLVEAQMNLERALTALGESKKPDLQMQVTCFIHLGNVYERAGQPDKAKEVFKLAVANWANELRSGRLTVVDIDYAMTNMDFGRGTVDVVEFYVDNIITMREKSMPKGHHDLDNSYKIGANLLRKAGYTQEADLLLQRGREGPPKNVKS